jgi:hypothetical protein
MNARTIGWPPALLLFAVAPLAAHHEPTCPAEQVVISVSFHPADPALQAAAPELRRAVYEYLAQRVVSRGAPEACMIAMVDQRRLEGLVPRIAQDVVWIDARIELNQTREEIGSINYAITTNLDTPGVHSNWENRRSHLFRRVTGAAAFSGDLMVEAMDGLQLRALRVESKPGLPDMRQEILRRMRP